MLDTKWFDEVAKKLSEAMPPAFTHFKTETERNFKVVLQSAFVKLDLVSREEFDIQSQLLAKARSQLIDLEQRVAELENNAKQSP